jgi:glycosyltransferase involved in cell wall biosynthesis
MSAGGPAPASPRVADPAFSRRVDRNFSSRGVFSAGASPAAFNSPQSNSAVSCADRLSANFPIFPLIADILIISTSPLSRNPRVLKEASALGRAGYQVTVLTVANQERYEAFDRKILAGAPFRKIVVDHLSRDWLSLARALPGRCATWLARRAAHHGLKSAQALGPAGALARRARSIRSDLAIVHNELGLRVGVERLRHGGRVAADIEDWHSRDLLPSAQVSRPLDLLERWEGFLLKRAAYASTTSLAMASALQASYGGNLPVVIRNSFPLQPDPAVLPHPGLPAFFWFSQTIGPGRMLEPFMDAWLLTKLPSRLCLLGEVDDAYRQALMNRVTTERRNRVEFLPVVPPWELPSLIARHDIGLAIEEPVPDNRNYTVSNKILQYMNAGLAVLATGTAGQREVLAQAPGAGLIANPRVPGELAAVLDGLIAGPERVAAMGAAARKAAEAVFCWERDEPRLLASVATALGNPPPA